MAWIYPDLRYYYDWYEVPASVTPPRPTDAWIKGAVVERLRQNPLAGDEDLRVDVKRGVVILQGVVASRLAKRSAGDDCWDTVGVTDVSNQLEVDEVPGEDDEPQHAAEIMATDLVALESSVTLFVAAEAMRDQDVGSVVVTEGGRVTGIVTDRDIVVRGLAAGRDPQITTLGAIESEQVVTIASADPVERAMAAMREHAVRRVVVVDGQRPVGVISVGDLARRRDPGSVLADIAAAPADEIAAAPAH